MKHHSTILYLRRVMALLANISLRCEGLLGTNKLYYLSDISVRKRKLCSMGTKSLRSGEAAISVAVTLIRLTYINDSLN